MVEEEAVEVEEVMVIGELVMLCESGRKAKLLEVERAAYFASLYDDIRVESIPLDTLTGERMSGRTDTQALEIIEKKRKYDRLIQRLHKRYAKWHDLLRQFTAREASILVRYFERGESIRSEVLEPVFRKAAGIVHQNTEAEEIERDQQAMEEFREVRKQLRKSNNEKSALEKLEAKKKSELREFIIDGRIIMATEEEYRAYQDEQQTKRKKLEERFKLFQ